MTAWTSDELNKIGKAEEIRIAALRNDGTLRNPVIIWVVRLGDDLYVRSVNGRTSAWFRGVQARHAGHIQVGGMEKDVNFVEETGTEINTQIDAAYRTKYRRLHVPRPSSSCRVRPVRSQLRKIIGSQGELRCVCCYRQSDHAAMSSRWWRWRGN